MGLAQFRADVAEARKTDYPGVTKIRPGDSDGEFVLICTPPRFGRRLEIHFLAQALNSYPKAANFMVFTTSEDVGEAAESFDYISSWTRGKPVQVIAATISGRLDTFLEDEDTSSDKSGQIDHEELETKGLDSIDSDLDYFLGISQLSVKSPSDEARSTTPMQVADLRRLKKDLRAAKAAGLGVGILPGAGHRVCEFVSLSIRLSKLGIPRDSLEAWGLKSSEYAVLLLSFPNGYPTASDYTGAARGIQFCFGKCSAAKPSLESVRSAFRSRPSRPHGNAEIDQDINVASSGGSSFEPLHMSKPINELLNDYLPNLLAIRRRWAVGWDSAQMHLAAIARDGHSDQTENEKPKSAAKSEDATVITDAVPQALRPDYATVDASELSLPLVSMQFALRRLVRCTQYCMMCHEKIHGEFESVKPELCSRDLCQYQYLSLGLGVSIEHEIIHNPFVVDLLVSFFYASLAGRAVRALPQGFNLRNYAAGFVTHWNSFAIAYAFCSRGAMTLKPATNCLLKVKEGDHVLLVQRDFSGKGVEAGEPLDILELPNRVCRITTVRENECTFRVLPAETVVNTQQVTAYGTRTKNEEEPQDGAEVFVYQYDQDLDTLNSDQLANTFQSIAKGIRSVLDMRAWLVNNPGSSLISWDRMHRSSLALLNWIVASNRSFIVQDDAVPSTDGSVLPHSNPNRVEGMGNGWMQFRFAQGSREREQLFCKALESELPKDTEYPTLFAWHGSPLKNWHSIIRTGLDFDSMAHGRSYGDGVYFSRHHAVSLGYVSPMTPWENSQLAVSRAISLCEIVNKPAGFRNSTPHYVVNEVNWIQCRYLFVKVAPASAAAGLSYAKQYRGRPSGYVVQEPLREVCGPKDVKLKIPQSSLPAARRSTKRAVGGRDSRTDPITLDTSESEMSDDCDADDIDLLPDFDDKVENLGSRGKRQRRSSDEDDGRSSPRKRNKARSSLGTTPNSKIDTHSQVHPDLVTEFHPGRLNLDSLPKLPAPTGAAFSREAHQRLLNDIKHLQKEQSRAPLPQLGWYIDFEKLNNVFHWIVELHSFDMTLPLAKDMAARQCTSIVLEFRFGSSYPFSPPFVRVVRPRFVPFLEGGGGHITSGGAVCSELLTNTAWSSALSLDQVFMQVRLGITEKDRPARLEKKKMADYSVADAVAAFRRAAASHGWAVPQDLNQVAGLEMGRR